MALARPVARSVVLSIRGTMTVEDCVTDVLYEPASLSEWLQRPAVAADGKRWDPPKLTLIGAPELLFKLGIPDSAPTAADRHAM